MGLVNLAEGNYAEAARALDGYNLAVAEVLNGNLAKAKSVLSGDNSARGRLPESQSSLCVKATAASAIANLKSAIVEEQRLRRLKLPKT